MRVASGVAHPVLTVDPSDVGPRFQQRRCRPDRDRYVVRAGDLQRAQGVGGRELRVDVPGDGPDPEEIELR